MTMSMAAFTSTACRKTNADIFTFIFGAWCSHARTAMCYWWCGYGCMYGCLCYAICVKRCMYATDSTRWRCMYATDSSRSRSSCLGVRFSSHLLHILILLLPLARWIVADIRLHKSAIPVGGSGPLSARHCRASYKVQKIRSPRPRSAHCGEAVAVDGNAPQEVARDLLLDQLSRTRHLHSAIPGEVPELLALETRSFRLVVLTRLRAVTGHMPFFATVYAAHVAPISRGHPGGHSCCSESAAPLWLACKPRRRASGTRRVSRRVSTARSLLYLLHKS